MAGTLLSRMAGVTSTALLALISLPAYAGPYADDLSRCFVDSTSTKDRSALVQWLFATASTHPAVSAITSVTPQQMEKANQTVGALFMRLMTDVCQTEAQKAIQFEGATTIQTSFGVLGQVAGQELFTSPQVTAAMQGIKQYIDSSKLEALGK